MREDDIRTSLRRHLYVNEPYNNTMTAASVNVTEFDALCRSITVSLTIQDVLMSRRWKKTWHRNQNDCRLCDGGPDRDVYHNDCWNVELIAVTSLLNPHVLGTFLWGDVGCHRQEHYHQVWFLTLCEYFCCTFGKTFGLSHRDGRWPHQTSHARSFQRRLHLTHTLFLEDVILFNRHHDVSYPQR